MTQEEDSKTEVNLEDGIPDIQPISSHLATLIDALPSLKDFEDLPKKQERIVSLWTERNALDEQLDEATELLQRLHGRLTALHEAMVINTPPPPCRKRKSKEESSKEVMISEPKRSRPSSQRSDAEESSPKTSS